MNEQKMEMEKVMELNLWMGKKIPLKNSVKLKFLSLCNWKTKQNLEIELLFLKKIKSLMIFSLMEKKKNCREGITYSILLNEQV